MRNDSESGGNLQSVRRAIRALELISEHGALGVTELGRKLEVHKATASRLMTTLAERGFVERDPISEKFRLGMGLISLAGAAVGGNDLVRAARPILDDLAERTRETVNLGVLSGESVVYIDQVAGTRSIVSVSWIGQRTPLHCTSNGKVLLAFATDAERDRMLRAPLPRLTPRTITDVRKLRAQLAEIRARGYAQTMEELEEGLNAVAAPVRGLGGDLVAALSVSGPAFRMRAVDLPRFGRFAMDSALAVSRRLGYVDRGMRAV
ncbi:MAG TPA: IclR family transcriptional regulator [Actinomycetota bacterium]